MLIFETELLSDVVRLVLILIYGEIMTYFENQLNILFFKKMKPTSKPHQIKLSLKTFVR
jgi:hypothetical protein